MLGNRRAVSYEKTTIAMPPGPYRPMRPIDPQGPSEILSDAALLTGRQSRGLVRIPPDSAHAT